MASWPHVPYLLRECVLSNTLQGEHYLVVHACCRRPSMQAQCWAEFLGLKN